MANIKFTNFASSTLSVGVNNTATSIVVASGQGARFPAPGAGEYFYVTLEDASLNREIVKVTARSSDTFTVVRGQDNTTARSWVAGDVVALRFNAAAIDDVLNEVVNKVSKTSSTGSAVLPAGTDAQRDGSPVAGYIRFNTTLGTFEGYDGSAWGAIGGGGATGGGSDEVFIQNDKVVTTNYTIPTDKNAMTTGPITINDGVSVTVSDGARWVVL